MYPPNMATNSELLALQSTYLPDVANQRLNLRFKAPNTAQIMFVQYPTNIMISQ